QRCGNTSASRLPAALRPVTAASSTCGCAYSSRASSAPAYPVTLRIPARTVMRPMVTERVSETLVGIQSAGQDLPVPAELELRRLHPHTPHRGCSTRGA